MKKHLFFMVGAFALIQMGYVQEVKGQSPPLKIGDKVPDVTLKHLLNTEKKQIRLSDLRGKLVILDFFATWCSSCIKELPRIDSLKKTREDVEILVVSRESQEKVRAFLAKNKWVKDLSLIFVTDDSSLNRLLPHKYIPHEVWIDKKGVFRASTSAEYITKEKVEEALSGEHLAWVMKNDYPLISGKEPLLSFTAGSGEAPSKLYYSGFTTYIEGADFNTEKIYTDSALGIKRLCIMNSPILNLYNKAFRIEKARFLSNSENRELLVKDTIRFLYDPLVYSQQEEWKRDHSYCYESVWPLATPEALIRKKLKEDIDYHFGLIGELRKKDATTGEKLFVLKEMSAISNL